MRIPELLGNIINSDLIHGSKKREKYELQTSNSP